MNREYWNKTKDLSFTNWLAMITKGKANLGKDGIGNEEFAISLYL